MEDALQIECSFPKPKVTLSKEMYSNCRKENKAIKWIHLQSLIFFYIRRDPVFQNSLNLCILPSWWLLGCYFMLQS